MMREKKSTSLKSLVLISDLRLRDRMVAAKIAMPFLQEVELRHLPELPKCVKKLSLNEMCAYVLKDLGISSDENIETRIWWVSLPIIHLATATAVAIDQLEKHGIQIPRMVTSLQAQT